MTVNTKSAASSTTRARLIAVLAGVALAASSAVAAPAVASEAQPAAATVTVNKFDQRKSPSTCKYLYWSFSASGLSSSKDYYADITLTRSTEKINSYTVESKVVNGTNKVKSFVCSTLHKAGIWKATVRVKTGGSVVAKSATVSQTIRVKPAVEIASVYGTIGGSATLTGYASPGVDTKGKTIKVYFKKKGSKTYKLIGTAKAQSSGYFKLTTTKLGLGYTYAKIEKQDYIVSSKSKSVQIVRTSSASASSIALD
ncbi:hypothetical protein [Cellulomonas persica]|uniref:Fibronectin type-III domain-containing protein n=1 Tax=Cellulomonas persica TaxID=76861 RepID=A0A510UYH6_9CELL|nr:hypothetical protein [Cellulomonas persica]GEK17865.1 hypothetical protein CPE01_15980 [Cellulomonas persica]